MLFFIVENSFSTRHGAKFLHIGFVRLPCGTRGVLHTFDSPQKIEYSQVAGQAVKIKNLDTAVKVLCNLTLK